MSLMLYDHQVWWIANDHLCHVLCAHQPSRADWATKILTLDTFTLLPSLENYSKLKVPREYEKKGGEQQKKSRTFGVKFVTSLRRSRQTQFISCWLREENIREGRRSSNYYDVCVVGHWAMPPLTWLGSLIWFAKKSFSFLTFNYRYWKSSAPFTAWLCNIL